MKLEFVPYLLKFKEPSGTSRGVLTEKPTFFIKVYDETDPSRFGIGEAAVFPGLSPEADEGYRSKLTELQVNFSNGKETDLSRYSSIQFGLEQAILDFENGGEGIYFPSDFTKGKKSIEINGLIWMGDFDKMLERVKEKIEGGFKCIKLKIGAIEWGNELDLIKYIRNHYSENDLMIRVDANGAFTFDKSLEKLKALADLGIHSIEQPIKAGQKGKMAILCKHTPLPIALDEELIGKYSLNERRTLLDTIKPQYIILKPALCGGFSGTSEWIELAEERRIGWWITSALESNIGLNAIAQFTASIEVKGPQGLGTGNLFTNNFETPVYLQKDRLLYNPELCPVDLGFFREIIL